MKVILLQNVKKMGAQGTIIEVADGYANSYLIPRKLARVASETDKTQSQAKTEYVQKKKETQQQENLDLFKRLNKKTVTITGNTNPQGHLFAAVKPTDLTSQIPGLKPEHLVMKDSIKEIGDYEIPLKVGENKGVILAKVTR